MCSDTSLFASIKELIEKPSRLGGTVGTAAHRPAGATRTDRHPASPPIVRDDEVCRRLMTTPGVGPVARPPTEAASLVLLRDPVNEPAGYTSKNIKCRMVKSLRQTGQPSRAPPHFSQRGSGFGALTGGGSSGIFHVPNALTAKYKLIRTARPAN
jgi:hypothetical protein